MAPNLNSKDYYDILGVPRGADDAALKKAYKKLAVKVRIVVWVQNEIGARRCRRIATVDSGTKCTHLPPTRKIATNFKNDFRRCSTHSFFPLAFSLFSGIQIRIPEMNKQQKTSKRSARRMRVFQIPRSAKYTINMAPTA